MESLKERLKKHTLVEKKDSERSVLPWQDFALKVIEDFGIEKEYKGMIFRYAKRSMPYLEGKVANAKEKFGAEGIKGKGRYLIALFRKKKPWE